MIKKSLWEYHISSLPIARLFSTIHLGIRPKRDSRGNCCMSCLRPPDSLGPHVDLRSEPP